MAQKFGFVAICGAPNAGKSTLLNTILGEKIAAASNKPQTTRGNTLGVYEKQNAQIAFMDTPGFLPSNNANNSLKQNTSQAIKSADIILFLVDISLNTQNKNFDLLENLLIKLDLKRTKIILGFNKIDKVDRTEIVKRCFAFQKYTQIHDFFMISAEKNEKIDDLLNGIIQALPEREWMYGSFDNKQNLKQWAAELTREQIFQKLGKEIPYKIRVEHVFWEEKKNDINIHQNIVVPKESQKLIVIGKYGAMLKSIGSAARNEIAKNLNRPVHLYLFVKIEKN
ncbi:MAG: GTPase Era [Holosporales bacterium]|jgi:GTP-binding protein Era|nr:GTPase Era [Holosporales bacterium]